MVLYKFTVLLLLFKTHSRAEDSFIQSFSTKCKGVINKAKYDRKHCLSIADGPHANPQCFFSPQKVRQEYSFHLCKGQSYFGWSMLL